MNADLSLTPRVDFLSPTALEQLTGTPASTWRYWAHIGYGPPSFKVGRRRVWKRSVVERWLRDQEAASSTGGGPE